MFCLGSFPQLHPLYMYMHMYLIKIFEDTKKNEIIYIPIEYVFWVL